MQKAVRFLVRFPWPAVAVLTAVLVLIATAGPEPTTEPAPPNAFTDIMLYRAITKRVQAGEDYYAVAAAEHRAHGYPLKPAVTVREPTEAWLLAAMQTDLVRRAGLFALGLFAVIAVHGALRDPMTRITGTVLAATCLVFVPTPSAPYIHEVWAGLLIACSLAVWRPGRYAASIALAVAACLFRELAAPVLMVMASFALTERRWREAGAWCAATAVFGALALIHLWLAGQQAVPSDKVSPGWLAAGGWNFILATARRNIILALLPSGWLSAAVAMSLVGLACAEGLWARRVSAVVLSLVGLFCFAGRPDNAYWGFLYAPLLPLGLLYAPRALRDLSLPLQAQLRRRSGRSRAAGRAGVSVG